MYHRPLPIRQGTVGGAREAPPSSHRCQASLHVFCGVVANPPTRHTESPAVRVSLSYVCERACVCVCHVSAIGDYCSWANLPNLSLYICLPHTRAHKHMNSARSIEADTWKVDFCTPLSYISRLEVGRVFEISKISYMYTCVFFTVKYSLKSINLRIRSIKYYQL